MWIPLLIVFACAFPANAVEKSFTEVFASDGIDVVAFDASAGDFELTASNVEEIAVEVTLTPRRGGVFSSMKGAEREVEEASLSTDIVGGRLFLEVVSDSGERRFEEHWTVRLPFRIGVELEVGLGDVTSRGLSGGIELEIGVGDAVVEAAGGDIMVNVGVGGATVRVPADQYGRVKASGGVGDARIKARGERIEGKGFVGHSASWVGEGRHRAEVEVGVGDARVTLE
jgi:hypothetical protein